MSLFEGVLKLNINLIVVWLGICAGYQLLFAVFVKVKNFSSFLMFKLIPFFIFVVLALIAMALYFAPYYTP